MCTVTISPLENNGFVFTSNRDEAPNRVSLAPEIYLIKGTRLLFPKDVLSGGTWIGVSEKNRLGCVLNGGFQRHKRQSKYRLSRGVMATEFLLSDDVQCLMDSYNFENIEPFTMVIVDWNDRLKFFELVWDGTERHISELPLKPKIWSSATLYNPIMRNERLDWFNRFKEKHNLNAESLMKFHKTAGGSNDDYGVIMDRGIVKTTSITQVEKNADLIKMTYENLQTNLVTTSQFKVPQISND